MNANNFYDVLAEEHRWTSEDQNQTSEDHRWTSEDQNQTSEDHRWTSEDQNQTFEVRLRRKNSSRASNATPVPMACDNPIGKPKHSGATSR